MKETDASAPFDFYVRLHEAALSRMAWVHLESGLDLLDEQDDRPCNRLVEGAQLGSEIRGYTEWISESLPVVSFGWDWSMTLTGTLQLNRHSIRTNLMLLDECGRDLGRLASVQGVMRLIDQREWQAAVLSAMHQMTGRCRVPVWPM
ncbi:DUF4902 domain-containing protein [Roseateles amylovorans]|jgi:Domain of unknown function (DUF4902)|uniref:DUF4902 domain-containing protein n=1 Tax=Roseateles amylovorans TaxID=2978473 RepID=A0ABY6B1S0_9BURK|nr:DUF4902 domain-containing protein [Roseateles amylovorans]UXH77463.1 DUF4902 domain-containing protein [Roseateles amylovorans]